jgi:NADH:ubiquinone oxidoreductase subunit C
MTNKYHFPMQVYIIFENLEPMVYTHDNLTPNHYVMLFPKNEIYNLSCVFKNEIFFSFNYLSEISAVDTLKYSSFLPETDLLFSKNRLLIYYIFYFYTLKTRLTIFSFYNTADNNITSIERNYDNANWLEREVSEMFQVNFILKRDNRNLLLDYSQNEHPMLKDFPTEGYKDLYYNFIEENLVYVDHSYIEL